MTVFRRTSCAAGAKLVLALLLGVLLAIAPAPAQLSTAASAAADDIGYEGPPTTGGGSAATGEKPESKLWWNDGSWWASLFDKSTQTNHIFRLDRTTQRWVDTGVMIDNRPKTRADVLWDGTKLYVASHVRASSSAGATSGNPARLYRFSYDPTTQTYTRDVGFPVKINDFSSETLTIDKDSVGVLWATWAQGSTVYVNSTVAGDATWGTPFVLPVPGASSLNSDDISALVSIRSGKIGLMWSNQTGAAMYFAEHTDGEAPGTWSIRHTALGGTGYADDHINLKSLEADSSGRVFAVVKTSLDDVGAPPSAPQVMLLVRDPSSPGKWSSYTVASIQDCPSRPILVLDSEHQMLYVFMTAPNSGCPYSGTAGTIFMKSSPMSNINFATGRGTPAIQDAVSPNLNNATATKQSVNSVTGMVVLASNDVTQRYWHADIPLETP